ncbi:MAG: hypothetical protein ACTSRK_20540 [Promethearchaeota archaeon]
MWQFPSDGKCVYQENTGLYAKIGVKILIFIIAPNLVGTLKKR